MMDSTINLTLEWSDFIPIMNLSYHQKNNRGVYVWGFKIGGEFMPYYVGIADKINLRIYEHVNSIIGGKYTIYHRNSLVNFKSFIDQEVQTDKSKGKIYLPNWPSSYKNFLVSRKDLQPHIDFMVDTFTFSFAVHDRKQDLRCIEKICINQIGFKNLGNTIDGICDKFVINHIGNLALTESFKGTNHI
ncbi:MAG: hypothetical protein ABI184_04985 [Ginsengibacter sp.]